MLLLPMITCDHCVGVGAAQLSRQQLGPPHHLGAQTLDAVVAPRAHTLVLIQIPKSVDIKISVEKAVLT